MRDIKFRAWSKFDTGHMHYWNDGFNYRWFERGGNKYVELMQYTGLKDKNGTEIYESDIVKCFPDDADDDAREVVYCGDRDYPAFDLKPDTGADSNGLSYAMAEGQIEVIGNIYEAPGLVDSTDSQVNTKAKSQDDTIDFIKDPETIKKAVEGSMDKRLEGMTDIRQQLTEGLLLAISRVKVEPNELGGMRFDVPDDALDDLLALISQTVSSVIGPELDEADGWDWAFGDEAKCCPGDDFAYFGNHLKAEQRATAKRLLGREV